LKQDRGIAYTLEVPLSNIPQRDRGWLCLRDADKSNYTTFFKTIMIDFLRAVVFVGAFASFGIMQSSGVRIVGHEPVTKKLISSLSL
jgi:hypothetical protein